MCDIHHHTFATGDVSSTDAAYYRTLSSGVRRTVVGVEVQTYFVDEAQVLVCLRGCLQMHMAPAHTIQPTYTNSNEAFTVMPHQHDSEVPWESAYLTPGRAISIPAGCWRTFTAHPEGTLCVGFFARPARHHFDMRWGGSQPTFLPCLSV